MEGSDLLLEPGVDVELGGAVLERVDQASVAVEPEGPVVQLGVGHEVVHLPIIGQMLGLLRVGVAVIVVGHHQELAVQHVGRSPFDHLALLDLEPEGHDAVEAHHPLAVLLLELVEVHAELDGAEGGKRRAGERVATDDVGVGTAGEEEEEGEGEEEEGRQSSHCDLHDHSPLM